MIRRTRLVALLALLTIMPGLAMAQLDLKVTVNVEEAGTLFVKIQEKIEELGELSDITELTISGVLNVDDYNVIRNQLTNLQMLDVSGLAAECGPELNIGDQKKLTKVILPTAATALRSRCIEKCECLTDIVMPSALTSIPEYFVNSCKMLEHIDIPQTVTKVGNGAFNGCNSLKDITLPKGVTEIGSMAFYECIALQSIVLPDSLKTLGNQAFRNCTALKQVTFPKGVMEIREGCFRNTGFESFTLPDGVKIVGDAAFGECKSLKSFVFPDGLKDKNEIGTSTLWHCESLESVRLPQDLTELPDYFFSHTRIPGIDLPPTVTEIGKYAYEGIESFTKAVIPDHVTKVGEYVFYESKIEEVVWSKNCHIIPNDAFRACKNLKSVTIPETVDSIQENAFYYCSALESIHLPEGIRYLKGTFNRCTSLKEVNIPSTVIYIGRGVEGCFNQCPLTHVDIPDGVTFIGFGSFSGVPLEEIKLPSKLKTIENRAFSGTKLKQVVVPEGVTSVGERAFGSDSLTLLDLPSTIIVLEGLPMDDERWNKKDATLICRALMPPYVKGNVFFEGTRKRTLYVPAPSLETYKAHNDFKVVNEILPLEGEISSGLLTIAGQSAITPESGLQAGKYDVKMYETWGNYDVTAQSDHHPRLSVEEGATFHVGTFNMEFDPADQWWFTSYKFQTFINRGTTTIDQIDVNCKFQASQFFTPAFDVRMSDIVPERPNTPYAIYRYDSGARAAGNLDNTWVKIGSDETLLAGQGYAYVGDQTPYWNDQKHEWSKEYSFLHFRSHEGGNNYFTTAEDVTLPLKHYSGEYPHNRNWNFIGMPYPAFLDIRGVDYDGPMLVFMSDSWDYGWKAWSALDDEAVIDPMHGIFIQAPDGVESITFSADRRQNSKTFVKDAEANGRNAVRRAEKNMNRMVYNLILSMGAVDSDESADPEKIMKKDRTRFVINPEATLRYDIGRDAPKMSNENDQTIEFYTQSGGLAYAINERPLDNGVVSLGMKVPEAGTYTLTLDTKSSEEVWLIDNEEQTRTLLSEPYTFTVSEPTTLTNRFVIELGNADPTAIDNVETAQPMRASGLFNLSGQPVNMPQRGIYIENGRIVIK